MSIIGESFEPWVENQIQIRQNLHGLEVRSNEQLTVLSNQNAWLKLGSSISVDDDDLGRKRLTDIGFTNPANFIGTRLAEKAVLFNSLSSLDINRDNEGNISSVGNYNMRSGVSNSNQSLWNDTAAYGLGGPTFGIVPPPGLISANIKAKNRGSIREANVEIKAHNKFQFEMLELLYLRLGCTMLLEWGWNKYYGAPAVEVKGEVIQKDTYKTTGSTLMEKYWFYNQKAPFTEVLGKIRQQRREYEGNYDGFLGKVTNFSWKFNPDGTYDINLKLITVGDVIESLKVNLPQNIVDAGELQQSIQKATNNVTIGLAEANSAIITNAGDSNLSYALYSDIVSPDVGKWDGSENGVKNNYLNLLGVVGRNLKQAENAAKFTNSVPTISLKKGKDDGVNTIKYSYFLTFRELLLKIQKYVLPSINGDKILGIDLSDDQVCAIYPYQVSFDPRICFIKPFFLDRSSFNTQNQFDNGKTAGGLDTGVINFWPFLSRVNDFGTQDNKAIYGNIMNIYLNYDFITSLLSDTTNEKGQIYLFKFLQNICDGINGALGGINNIECVLNDDRIITFIDQNPIPSIETSTKYKDRFGKVTVPFELFGYNPATKNKTQTSNFVRDFGFDTKITPELASMIAIGTTAEGIKTKNYDATAFSKWMKGLTDRYTTIYDDPETPPLVSPSTSSNEYDPLTIEQIQKISKKWDESEEDTHWGPFPRRAFVETNFGITKKGHKEIYDCSVTGRDYINVTWSEYSNAVRAWAMYRQLKNKQEDQNPKNVSYMVYLANAFGGRVRGIPIIYPYYFKFDPDFISMGKNSFKGFVNGISNEIYRKTGEPSNTIGFIPVDLNLKCDGLSGIKIYNQLAIRQEFLPRAYPKALKFVITQVNHKIDQNDWTTELHTISTANTQNTVLTADLFTTVEYDLSDSALSYTLGADGNALISGIVGDPEPIINPNKYGKDSYRFAPITQDSIAKGGVNGRMQETALQLLVLTDEKGGDNLKKYHGEDYWRLNIYAWEAYKKWRTDAKAAGIDIGITTAYRNLAYQEALKKEAGEAAAPAGNSPHGWGGAIDLRISGLRYTGGVSAEANLNDRLKENWKIVATIAARYGWYNPWRLADNKKRDEAWHFEYWGPASSNYINPSAVNLKALENPSSQFGVAFAKEGTVFEIKEKSFDPAAREEFSGVRNFVVIKYKGQLGYAVTYKSSSQPYIEDNGKFLYFKAGTITVDNFDQYPGENGQFLGNLQFVEIYSPLSTLYEEFYKLK